MWALIATAVLVTPLVYIVVRLAGGDPTTSFDLLLRPRLVTLLGTSLGLALGVGATTLVLGVAQAVAIVRLRLPAPGVLMALVLVPLAMPSYVAAFGWLGVVPWLHGPVATWAILSLVCAPYVALPSIAALRSTPTDLEVTARTLGDGPVRAWFRATWPRIRPSATAGALLASLYGLADFGVVSLLRVETLSTAIARAMGATFDRSYAALLAAILVALALGVVALETRVRGRVAPELRARHASLPKRDTRASWLVAAAVALPAVLIAAVPLTALLVRVLTVSWQRDLDVAGLIAATASTLTLATVGALVAVALALPVALLDARERSRASGVLLSLVVASHGLPGIVVGLALVFASLTLLPGLYQTIAWLVLAYGILATARCVGTLRSALAAVPLHVEHVARSLGAPPASAFLRSTARIALPGASAAGVLAALTLAKELPATLLLRPIGVDTLATELWSRTAVSQYASAAPYALMLVLVAAVPAFVISWTTGRMAR